MKVITRAKDRRLEASKDGAWIAIREWSREVQPGYTKATWTGRCVGVTIDELRKILREAEAGAA